MRRKIRSWQIVDTALVAIETSLAEKLPQLINLKYHAMADAVADLGTPADIRTVFVDFQKQLYSESSSAGGAAANP